MTVPSSAVSPVIGTLNSDKIFAEAEETGKRNVERICAITEANELERASITRFEAIVRHGSKFIDLHVRRDGKEYHFEADWLARLFRAENPLASKGEGG